MEVYTYMTNGGKNLIYDFLDKLPTKEASEGYRIINELETDGYKALEILNTRQICEKLWEIKFRRHNRMFYIVFHKDKIYLLHACKKQKNKAEKFEIEKALKRMDSVIRGK